uniref:Uncharacterized protein n=1 Tax=Cacopsylla melanoneura TaxID=428564 RepID=A0A8D8YK26_9HEMI
MFNPLGRRPFPFQTSQRETVAPVFHFRLIQPHLTPHQVRILVQQLKLEVAKPVADDVTDGTFVVDDDRVLAVVEDEKDLTTVSLVYRPHYKQYGVVQLIVRHVTAGVCFESVE